MQIHTGDPLWFKRLTMLRITQHPIHGDRPESTWLQFAGQKNVTVRFEFSTGASFRTNDPVRGGVELKAVEGSRLVDGDTFQIATVDQTPASNQTFEFDLGLVLDLPGGKSIANGSQINVNGNIFTFSTSSGAETTSFIR